MARASGVVRMVFTSIYSVVDGLFVSNFAGATAFAAVNLIMPLLMGMGTVGFLIGTGGSAVVAKTLGEGKHELACRYFSMLIYVTVALGALLYFAEALERIFGKNVIRIFSKVSGVILMAMAAQMIATGFFTYLDNSTVGQKLLEALAR